MNKFVLALTIFIVSNCDIVFAYDTAENVLARYYDSCEEIVKITSNLSNSDGDTIFKASGTASFKVETENKNCAAWSLIVVPKGSDINGKQSIVAQISLRYDNSSPEIAQNKIKKTLGNDNFNDMLKAYSKAKNMYNFNPLSFLRHRNKLNAAWHNLFGESFEQTVKATMAEASLVNPYAYLHTFMYIPPQSFPFPVTKDLTKEGTGYVFIIGESGQCIGRKKFEIR